VILLVGFLFYLVHKPSKLVFGLIFNSSHNNASCRLQKQWDTTYCQQFWFSRI